MSTQVFVCPCVEESAREKITNARCGRCGGPQQRWLLFYVARAGNVVTFEQRPKGSEDVSEEARQRQQHRLGDADKQVCSTCSQNSKDFDGTGRSQVWWEEKGLGREWWGGAGLWAWRALEGRLL